MLETGRSSARLTCDCGESFTVSVLRVLNLKTHKELLDSLLAGRLNLVRCSACGREYASDTPLYVHDPAHPRYVCCFPSAWRSRELEVRVGFYQELLGFGARVPAYVRAAQFVFGLDAWAKALGGKEPPNPWDSNSDGLSQEPEPDPGPVILPAMDADGLDPTIALMEPQPSTQTELAGAPAVQELEESDFEGVSDAMRHDRRTSALVERWRESGQTHYTFLDDGALHIFQLHADSESFGTKADIFFQLHRIENFPVVTLLLVAAGTDGVSRVLYWLFNMDNRIDVRFLEALGKRFEVRLHLFDTDYVLVKSQGFSQSLEQNVAYVLEQARAWLDQIDPKRRNFFIAASKFDESSYRKLGSGPGSLDVAAFRDLPTPAVTRLALDILTWWSSREQYEYLIFIKSFPVTRFKAIVTGVLGRALHFGLSMSKKMKRMAVEFGIAPSEADLVRLQLEQFSRLAKGSDVDDMDPNAQVENWQQLIEDAQSLGVPVSKATLELAWSAERVLDECDSVIALDLSDDLELLGAFDQLETGELLSLLKESGNRAAAALVLAESGRSELLQPVLQAFERMGKSEFEELGDSLAGFGEIVREPLMKFIHAERGSKLLAALRALVRLDGRRTAGLLIDQVVAGHRGVWREAVRLLRSLDVCPVDRLLEASRHPEPRVRSRVALALQARLVCNQPEEGLMERLEQMAGADPSAQVRTAARQALQAVCS
jgi:hypothetical protein